MPEQKSLEDVLGELIKEYQERIDQLRAEIKERLMSISPLIILKLGTGLKTADDFRQALAAGDCRLGDRANDIIGGDTFTTATEETEVELVAPLVADLGFEKGTEYREICEREWAKQLGLDSCPAEVGPQLRLQYKNQPNGERLYIMMQPITGSDGDPYIFSVEYTDGCLWLGDSSGRPDHFCYAEDRFVFVRRK